MQTKVLIAINFCLAGLLLFIITFFHLENDDQGLETRQYTLLLQQPEQISDNLPNLNIQASLKDHIESIVDTRNRVSFLIGDLGINNELTTQVITDFPVEISLGFSIYSQTLKDFIGKLGQKDILLSLPITRELEGLSIALDNGLPSEENLKRLSLILSQLEGSYSGIYTESNKSFLFASNTINEIMQVFTEKNKYLCYGGPDKIVKYIAKENGVGFITPDIVIEYDFDEDMVKDRLGLISTIHKYQKDILVLVKPSPIAIEALREFTREEHDFQLTKITDMVG